MLMFQEKISTVHELIRHATRSIYNKQIFQKKKKKNEIQKIFLTQNVDNTPVCIVIIHVHSQFLNNENVHSKQQMDDYFVQNAPVCILILLSTFFVKIVF